LVPAEIPQSDILGGVVVSVVLVLAFQALERFVFTALLD